MRLDEIENLTTPALEQVINPALETLDKLFKSNNYDIRIVGGAVRDIALGKVPKDIDLASDATPDEIIAMLDNANIRHKPTGLEHGTLTVIIDDEPYEITTLRADTETTGRHATVNFIRNWKEDARRRDLTYNAMSLDFDGTLYDYFGGMNDLQNSTSKFVGDADQRIKEDYLRILRYFRFQARIENPSWSLDTLDAVKDNAKGLTNISVERVWQEMQKLLVSPSMASAINWMNKTGVAKYIGLDIAGTPKQFTDPIISLANIVNDASIGQKWKLSNNEKALLNFLVANKVTKLDQDQAENLIADEIPAEYVQALAMLQGVTLKPIDIPEFPVAGKDLVSMGIKPGPEIGRTLANLKQAWKDDKFTPSKSDLLNQLTSP
jgi:tRNA nucleotidyltransferase (CCA-adding enzyme)